MTSRTLGGVGSLLMVISSISALSSLIALFFPSSTFSIVLGFLGIAFSSLSFVGTILFLVAMNGLANYYQKRSIFNNALYGFLTLILGVIVSIIVAMVAFFSTFNSLFQEGINTVSNIAPSQVFTNALLPFLIVTAIFPVIQTLFYMRAFNKLAWRSGVRKFRTVGLLLLIGTIISLVLSSVVFVLLFASLPLTSLSSLSSTSALSTVSAAGSVVVFVAWIIAAQAFFSLKPQTVQASPPVPPAPDSQIPVVGSVKYCPYCGTQNILDATYCKNCGKKL